MFEKALKEMEYFATGIEKKAGAAASANADEANEFIKTKTVIKELQKNNDYLKERYSELQKRYDDLRKKYEDSETQVS